MMKCTKTDKKQTALISIIFGGYFVFLFWFTIFSREFSSGTRSLGLFYDYRLVFTGNIEGLKGIVGNIALFLPVGYFLQLILKKHYAKTVLMGFCISLCIEIIQLITKRGFFEFDDLLHNSIGTFLGAITYKKIKKPEIKNLKKTIKCIIASTLLIGTIVFLTTTIINGITKKRMEAFAALSNTEEYSNLLVLNGKEGYINDEDISLTYQDDGQVRITGISDTGEWLRVADISLEAGTYSFGGLPEVENNTISMSLLYFDENKQDFLKLVSNIGPIQCGEFTLDTETNIRAYFIINNSYNCDIYARPVIYKIQ